MPQLSQSQPEGRGRVAAPAQLQFRDRGDNLRLPTSLEKPSVKARILMAYGGSLARLRKRGAGGARNFRPNPAGDLGAI